MAKIFEVCKRPYPDDRPACPHCAAEVIEVAEDAIVINPPDDGSKPSAGPGSSSAVDLGAPGSGVGSSAPPADPSSGVSVVEWASLVEDPPSQASAAPPGRGDAPSDQGIGGHADSGAPTAPHPGPTPAGPLPATGSVAALISRATGVDPYYVGKPNPLMMRSALNALDAHSETAAMVGDRMDTDIVAGLEAGLEAILVLTGVTARGDAERHPYRPSRIVESVAELVDELD